MTISNISVASVYTEITDHVELNANSTAIRPARGEMGTRWGINRTVAQIHALLSLSPEPRPAEEIAKTLSVARSNVSTSISIRALESWGLVHPVHVLGDRREHYETLKDVYQIFHIIVEQRKCHEVDPTMQRLWRCLVELKREHSDAYTRERLKEMAEFFEGAPALYEEINRLSPHTLRGLLKARSRLRKLLRSRAE